jgi:hypothetical protein
MLKPTVLSSALCVLFLTVSCKGITHTVTISQPSAGGALQVTDPFSNSSESDLRSVNDDRVDWVNSTGSDVYVCFAVSDSQPFEAMVWGIPAKGNRNSGKIRKGGGSAFYSVVPSLNACSAKPPEGNPYIKIN